MYLGLKQKILELNFSNLNQNLFLLGIFLLPSSLFVGNLIVLLVVFIDFVSDGEKFFKEIWNIPLVICFFLLIFSTLFNLYLSDNNLFDKNNWPSIFNWIPFFISFWAFQKHLYNEIKRKQFSEALIFGTIPVIFSCFSQYFLNWYGPYEFLNGLVVWYQRPIIDQQGITALFNNPNYLSTWLSITLPFCIYLFLKKEVKYKLLKKGFFLIFIFLITYFLILTKSRFGISSIFLSLPILLFKNIFIGFALFIGIIILYTLILYLTLISPNFSIFLTNLLEKFQIENVFLDKFFDIDLFNFMNSPRLFIWRKSFLGIVEKPFWGHGPGSSKFIIGNNSQVLDSEIYQHSHNIFLELGLDYGSFASIIILFTLTIIIIKSFRKIYISIYNSKNVLLDKIWFLATSIILLHNMVDLTYYDGRISLVFWILFAGLKCSLDENKYKNST